MQTNAYMTLIRQTGGQIQGFSTIRGRENKIIVFAANHFVERARPGTFSGFTQHKPFTIIKAVDKSSPLLYAAMAQNQKLSDCLIEFYTIRGAGTSGDTLFYTISLHNAFIDSIHFVKPNVKDTSLAAFAEYEEVSFVFETIEWTWIEGNIRGNDTVHTTP